MAAGGEAVNVVGEAPVVVGDEMTEGPRDIDKLGAAATVGRSGTIDGADTGIVVVAGTLQLSMLGALILGVVMTGATVNGSDPADGASVSARHFGSGIVSHALPR